ncbi:glutamate 5-kinase [bacterium]|nr:glutamate 5-kinase [bacterium]
MNTNGQYQRVVVKVGTSTLTDGGQGLCLARMVDLARQLTALRTAGIQVVLVSSGGIAAGREAMAQPDLPRFLPAKQLLAAVGQPRLMAIYTQLFTLYEQQIAQVLLTREDLTDRRRYLNARNTLEALLDYGIIPIINENDTIATEEIRFGDNDNLSALIANVLEADLLLLLTDQEGVFWEDPTRNPDAELVRLVGAEAIPPELLAAATESRNGLGTGGMASKLSAAELARHSGAKVVIANGATDRVIPRIVLDGEALGTTFLPLATHLESRKRFLLAGMAETSGKVLLDAGAVRALRAGGSILPVGITAVEGDFSRGQSVTVADPKGETVAVGLCNYSAADISRIAGQQSDQIEAILGYAYGAEVVHHDNLVLL